MNGRPPAAPILAVGAGAVISILCTLLFIVWAVFA